MHCENADENQFENESNYMLGRRKYLNMLLQRSRDFISDRDPDEYENTEVTELQILREHSEFLTTFAVFEDTIYSSCADGQILCHVFPKVQGSANVRFQCCGTRPRGQRRDHAT